MADLGREYGIYMEPRARKIPLVRGALLSEGLGRIWGDIEH